MFLLFCVCISLSISWWSNSRLAQVLHATASAAALSGCLRTAKVAGTPFSEGCLKHAHLLLLLLLMPLPVVMLATYVQRVHAPLLPLLETQLKQHAQEAVSAILGSPAGDCL